MNKTPIVTPAPVPFFARPAAGRALTVKTGIKAGMEDDRKRRF